MILPESSLSLVPYVLPYLSSSLSYNRILQFTLIPLPSVPSSPLLPQDVLHSSWLCPEICSLRKLHTLLLNLFFSSLLKQHFLSGAISESPLRDSLWSTWMPFPTPSPRHSSSSLFPKLQWLFFCIFNLFPQSISSTAPFYLCDFLNKLSLIKNIYKS